MTTLLESLLGSSLAEFEQGEVAFVLPLSPAMMLTSAALLCLLAWYSYQRTTVALGRGAQAGLIVLRALLFLLLLGALLQPVVKRHHVVPQESYLAILVDDSGSMTVRDASGGRTRGEEARELLFGTAGIAEAFSRNYRTRLFRFDRNAERITGAGDLSFHGVRSSIGEGLVHVLEELKGFPLAAVVLLSDGADNGAAESDPLQAARYMDAAGVPIHTVALGSETIDRDIEMLSASASRTVLDDSQFVVEVAVANSGYDGARAQVLVEQEDGVVASRRITLGTSGSFTRDRFELRPERTGYLQYRISVTPQSDEVITQNNARTVLLDNREGEQLEVLYIEGRPRNEYKFILRAAATDPSLRLASYLQTGPGKFLRQGLESPRELEEGFPEREQELFRYEAILFGDVARSQFSDRQLESIEQFVARRGGGFLSLGLVEEAFEGTPIADLLPLDLVAEAQLPSSLKGGSRHGDHPTGEDFSLLLTREGRESPLLRLASDDRVNLRLWSQMPALQGIEVSGRPKPGAQVLARHPTLKLGEELLPVIAVERYGRGRTMAITSPSTWRWQMLAPLENDSHERIWRQVLRWLTMSAPARVEIALAQQTHAVGEPVDVEVRLTDNRYEGDDEATVWIEVTAPNGRSEEFPLAWAMAEEGVYKGDFVPAMEGIYELSATATTAAGSVLATSTAMVAAPSTEEFRDAGRDSALMRRVAEISGGRFYTGPDAGRLVSDVEFSPSAYSRVETEELWDAPLLLLLIVLLAGCEWLVRRRLGLS